VITDLEAVTVGLNATMLEVMQAINDNGLKIVLVTDSAGVLLATVTDGDVRRGILNGVTFEQPVSKIIKPNPKTVSENCLDAEAHSIMEKYDLFHIPKVDNKGRLIGLVMRHQAIDPIVRENRVVLMAGGLGLRLRPLTKTTPKPMITVGEKPLLDHIMIQFAQQGFRKFTVSVNYLGHLIQEYFGTGQKFGLEVDYIEETEPMGTAGALSLMPHKPIQPVIVMNADIITNMSFSPLLDFHNRSGSCITLCARNYSVQVPYGVVKTEGETFVSIVEKPTYKYSTSAGIYILSPEALEFLDHGKALDMPDLIAKVKEADHLVSVYLLDDYWIDIGKFDDLDRARADYKTIFYNNN